MIAAQICGDSAIRKAYDKILWVSMGQSADILALQRQLYTQLTGEAMTKSPDTTVEKQLKQLRTAAVGERLLVVLDGRGLALPILQYT